MIKTFLYAVFSFIVFILNLQADSFLKSLVKQDKSDIQKNLQLLANSGDEKYIPVLDAYRLGMLIIYNDEVYYNLGNYENDDLDEFVQIASPYTREPIALEGMVKGPKGASMIDIFDIETIEPNRTLRKSISKAMMVINLFSKNSEKQLSAIGKMAFYSGAIEFISELDKIASQSNHKLVKRTAKESHTIICFREGTDEQRLNAILVMESISSLRTVDLINERISELSKSEKTEDIEKELGLLNKAKNSVTWHQFKVEIFNLIKSGLSSGSILILMALGLSITFGMMGIINMAHGELMMVGAYTTYCTQLIFGHTSNNPNNIYFLFALPASFIMAMLVGALIELSIVRKLYKHPLESLLATYGIGLILIQVTRLIFGDNCPSNSPTWLQGGFEISQDMVLQYNRLFIFFLTLACLISVIWLFRYTSLGLKMKASMQNRDMASAMGINTRKVDLFTFMLGSGLAGIAGNALITVGGITPDMGKNYIVDSFLVVVTGGVGNVLGVTLSGMGLGLIKETLESLLFGAVWSKIIVLLLVIIFIQFRPSGLFAIKGRHADD